MFALSHIWHWTLSAPPPPPPSAVRTGGGGGGEGEGREVPLGLTPRTSLLEKVSETFNYFQLRAAATEGKWKKETVSRDSL